MAEFLTLLKSRKTTYEYSSRAVSDAALGKILEAARWSPSFLNLQPWEFVVVKEKESVVELLKAAYYGVFSYNDYKGEPPVAVAIVLKKRYWEGQYGYPRRDKPGIFEAYLSIAMPAMNMALQAEELGISSSILNVNSYVAERCLKLKGGDTAPLLVCLGYEKPGAREKKRTRKSLESIVHYGHCGTDGQASSCMRKN
ncbi:malonic semialdehyde reductase RutE [uncultured archaeon]|nr:malonic semialdehyde reductase RutE [uncultured archaeon]